MTTTNIETRLNASLHHLKMEQNLKEIHPSISVLQTTDEILRDLRDARDLHIREGTVSEFEDWLEELNENLHRQIEHSEVIEQAAIGVVPDPENDGMFIAFIAQDMLAAKDQLVMESLKANLPNATIIQF